jgi:hypothetical protein
MALGSFPFHSMQVHPEPDGPWPSAHQSQREHLHPLVDFCSAHASIPWSRLSWDAKVSPSPLQSDKWFRSKFVHSIRGFGSTYIIWHARVIDSELEYHRTKKGAQNVPSDSVRAFLTISCWRGLRADKYWGGGSANDGVSQSG